MEKLKRESKIEDTLKTTEIKKQLLTKLLDAFKENSEWNSYLPDHPAIIKFKSEIINELKKNEVDNRSLA